MDCMGSARPIANITTAGKTNDQLAMDVYQLCKTLVGGGGQQQQSPFPGSSPPVGGGGMDDPAIVCNNARDVTVTFGASVLVDVGAFCINMKACTADCSKNPSAMGACRLRLMGYWTCLHLFWACIPGVARCGVLQVHVHVQF